MTASMTAATMAAFRKVFIVKNPCWPDFPWNVKLAAHERVAIARVCPAILLELTYNWDKEDYGSARNFGHLAFEIDDIYAFCERLREAGVTINRPPRDGRMAFIRSPDNISIEILQKGSALPRREPWGSMPDTGTW